MLPKDILLLFVNKNDVRKLVIFELLIKNKFISFSKVREEFDLSDRNVKKAITMLVSDIEQYDSQMTIKYSSQIMYLVHSRTFRENILIYEKLQKDYLKGSTLLTLFYKILSKKEYKVYDLSIDLNYSISYCYKLINQCNMIFRLLKLDVEFIVQENSVYVEGHTIDIILFRYYTYILSGIEGNLDSKDYKYISLKNNDVLSKSNKFKINSFMYFIIDTINKYPLRQALVEELFYIGKIGSKYSNSIWKVQSLFLNLEIEGFCFLLILHIAPEVISLNEKISIAKNIKENYIEKPLIYKVVKIIDCADRLEQYSEEQYYLILFEMVVKLEAVRFFKLGRFTTISQIYLPDRKYPQSIVKLIDTELLEGIQEEEREFANRYVLNLLFDQFHQENLNSVKIYIEFYIETMYVDVVKKYITDIYNQNFVMFTTNIYEADIIISDMIHTDFILTTPVVLFGDLFDKHAWKLLSEYIQDVLFTNKGTYLK
ncbi:hypothetical protein ET009_09045 [Lactococcus garvieae]|nr:hypothetical protein [Lactococcus garvieae]